MTIFYVKLKDAAVSKIYLMNSFDRISKQMTIKRSKDFITFDLKIKKIYFLDHVSLEYIYFPHLIQKLEFFLPSNNKKLIIIIND